MFLTENSIPQIYTWTFFHIWNDGLYFSCAFSTSYWFSSKVCSPPWTILEWIEFSFEFEIDLTSHIYCHFRLVDDHSNFGVSDFGAIQQQRSSYELEIISNATKLFTPSLQAANNSTKQHKLMLWFNTIGQQFVDSITVVKLLKARTRSFWFAVLLME